MHPRLVLALSLLVVATLGAVVLARGSTNDEVQPPSAGTFAGATLPPDVPAPDFDLTDEQGAPISMGEFRGSPVVVTFLYANCEETCPGQAQQIKGALDQLGHDLPTLAISVDPPNDTPEAAREFLNDARMTGRMRWVLGTEDELEPLWKGYAIQPQSRDVEHQARLVLVDGRGRQRVGFPLNQATPERIAHDLRILEAEDD